MSLAPERRKISVANIHAFKKVNPTHTGILPHGLCVFINQQSVSGESEMEYDFYYPGLDPTDFQDEEKYLFVGVTTEPLDLNVPAGSCYASVQEGSGKVEVLLRLEDPKNKSIAYNHAYFYKTQNHETTEYPYERLPSHLVLTPGLVILCNIKHGDAKMFGTIHNQTVGDNTFQEFNRTVYAFVQNGLN